MNDQDFFFLSFDKTFLVIVIFVCVFIDVITEGFKKQRKGKERTPFGHNEGQKQINTCGKLGKIRREKILSVDLNWAKIQFDWTGRLEVAGVKCTLGLHEHGA